MAQRRPHPESGTGPMVCLLALNGVADLVLSQAEAECGSGRCCGVLTSLTSTGRKVASSETATGSSDLPLLEVWNGAGSQDVEMAARGGACRCDVWRRRRETKVTRKARSSSVED